MTKALLVQTDFADSAETGHYTATKVARLHGLYPLRQDIFSNLLAGSNFLR